MMIKINLCVLDSQRTDLTKSDLKDYSTPLMLENVCELSAQSGVDDHMVIAHDWAKGDSGLKGKERGKSEGDGHLNHEQLGP